MDKAVVGGFGPPPAGREGFDTQLHTAVDGHDRSRPWLVLHDRMGRLRDARDLRAAHLPPEVYGVAVRSARTQSRGGFGAAVGNFWYIGPLDRPELTTLGDGLYHLDGLLEAVCARCDGATIGVLGAGEGAVMALLLGLMRPDLVGRIICIGGVFPQNFDRIPLEWDVAQSADISVVDDGLGRSSCISQGLRARFTRARVAEIPQGACCI